MILVTGDDLKQISALADLVGQIALSQDNPFSGEASATLDRAAVMTDKIKRILRQGERMQFSHPGSVFSIQTSIVAGEELVEYYGSVLRLWNGTVLTTASLFLPTPKMPFYRLKRLADGPWESIHGANVREVILFN